MTRARMAGRRGTRLGSDSEETRPRAGQDRCGRVDLMEYQAKELFAKHDVPVTLGIVATTPAEARAAAEELGVVVV